MKPGKAPIIGQEDGREKVLQEENTEASLYLLCHCGPQSNAV